VITSHAEKRIYSGSLIAKILACAGLDMGTESTTGKASSSRSLRSNDDKTSVSKSNELILLQVERLVERKMAEKIAALGEAWEAKLAAAMGPVSSSMESLTEGLKQLQNTMEIVTSNHMDDGKHRTDTTRLLQKCSDELASLGHAVKHLTRKDEAEKQDATAKELILVTDGDKADAQRAVSLLAQECGVELEGATIPLNSTSSSNRSSSNSSNGNSSNGNSSNDSSSNGSRRRAVFKVATKKAEDATLLIRNKARLATLMPRDGPRVYIDHCLTKEELQKRRELGDMFRKMKADRQVVAWRRAELWVKAEGGQGDWHRVATPNSNSK
jgi:hypothetical protein